jgi:hypothetical protein
MERLKGRDNNLILFLFAVAVFCASCTHKINPDRPELADSDFRLDSLPDSEINVPVQVSLHPLYAMAEGRVDTLYTSEGYPERWIQEGCDTRYKYVFRRGPLQLRASGTSLSLGFVGYYKIVGSTRVCVSGTAISPWTPPCRCGFDEPERRVNVSFVNSISLSPDYRIKLQIRRNEPQALDKCSMCFWGQNVTNEVLNGLKLELDAAKAELEKKYGTVDLKPQFQQLWNQLGKGFNIYGMGWLDINPQRIRINNMFAKNDSLYVNLGLAARPAISFEKPADRESFVPSMGNFARNSGFSVFLDAMLNYDSLSIILNKHMVNKEFDFNKGPVRKKFIIKDCKLFGSGNEKIIIKISFEGTDEGTMYLIGKPVFDKDHQILELKDIDFDIKSKDALLKTAEWLFSRRIISEVTRNTRFDLNGWMDTVRLNMNQRLNQGWIRGVSSTGSINEIKLIGIYPLNKGLVIRSNCSGTLALKVDSIDFSL